MSQEPLKILYVLQEMLPYTSLETELSKLGRELPQLAQENGYEIRIFMPRFGVINERRNQLHEVQRLSGMNVIINDTDHPLLLKVASISAAHMQVYFIDNEEYFQRKACLVNEKGKEFSDNDDRMIFYARSVLETIKKLRWTPDLIQCCGWFSAVVPLYVRRVYHDDPFFSHSKIVCSLFNDKFTKDFPVSFSKRLMVDKMVEEDVATVKGKVDYNRLMKFSINYCDAVVASSEKAEGELLAYAKEGGKVVVDYSEDWGTTYMSLYKKILG